jgi:hypothetical protein
MVRQVQSLSCGCVHMTTAISPLINGSCGSNQDTGILERRND